VNFMGLHTFREKLEPMCHTAAQPGTTGPAGAADLAVLCLELTRIDRLCQDHFASSCPPSSLDPL
jgi:hypothetical protein